LTATNRVRLAPAGGNGRPLVVAVLIILAVGIGLIKPWGSGPPLASGPATAAQTTRPSIKSSPGPVAIASPDPASNTSGPCYWGLAWRLFTAETSDVGPVQTWYGLQPLQASGPADPRIAVVRIHSTAIGQLGYCSVSRPGPIHILETLAWRLRPGSSPQPVVLAPAGGAALVSPDAGVIYGPPASASTTAVWAPATYVFSVRLATTPTSDEWFAVQIL
jgi:hypothetical protein